MCSWRSWRRSEGRWRVVHDMGSRAGLVQVLQGGICSKACKEWFMTLVSCRCWAGPAVWNLFKDLYVTWFMILVRCFYILNTWEDPVRQWSLERCSTRPDTLTCPLLPPEDSLVHQVELSFPRNLISCKGMEDFAQILSEVCPSPCSGVAQGSLSDFWRWYLSFWWLGQPNTSYCILSEERGNAVWLCQSDHVQYLVWEWCPPWPSWCSLLLVFTWEAHAGPGHLAGDQVVQELLPSASSSTSP